MANAFTSSGIKKGDRAAFLSKNSIERVHVLCRRQVRRGAGADELSSGPHQWAFIINDSQAKMAMASPEYLEVADGLRPELGIVSQYVSVGAGNSPAWTGFDSWVNAHPGSDSGEYIEGGDDVIQMYTSSTTGHPKGVVLTHDSLTANIARPP